MPTQRHVIKDNSDGTVNVVCQPQIEGKHEVQWMHNGEAVEGTPFSCLVDNVSGAHITVFGEGLSGAKQDEPATFTVYVKQGTAKDLVVDVEGPNKVDVKRSDGGEGCITVSYTPTAPGTYSIPVKYKGKHMKGSPFNAKVLGVITKRSHLSLADGSVYSLRIMEPDISALLGKIKTPKGNIEPCILKELKDGELGVSSFDPREKGNYQVSVYNNDKNIKGSPFTIAVGDKELGHAAKVKVTGAISEANANQTNQIVIDTTGAGYGGLNIVIDGPHRSDIDLVHKKTQEIYVVQYSPHEPGIYTMNVTFADNHVQGSPFLLNVGGTASGRVREVVSKTVGSIRAEEPGHETSFVLHVPGSNPFDMEASFTDPNGSTELCDVMDKEDSHYQIKFTPKAKGTHVVSLKHKGMHVGGSPFVYTVGQMTLAGGHRVQIGGPGLERGEVKIPNVFNIYTREAGPGELSVAAEGPSKAKIQLRERDNGFLGCSYTVDKPGMYGVHVKYDDNHVPNSPCMVNIAPDSGLTKQVTVQAFKNKGLTVNKPMTFTVNFNGAKGELRVAARTPVGDQEECPYQEMDTGLYGVRFVPKMNGLHYLDVKVNNSHILDSPYAVMVGSTGADPALIIVSGDGVEKSKCGQKATFGVRTVGAGSGILSVMVEGPSKTTITCKESDAGYDFSYTPYSPGDYYITIKYGSIAVPGSPFKAVASGKGPASSTTTQSSMVVEAVEKTGAKTMKRMQGDASQVTVKGPGLKKIFTNRALTIMVDVRNAGQSMLNVGMMTPSGNPVPELAVKKSTTTTYQLTYKTQEIGDHVLQIKWGDDDIPGSPFFIGS